MIERSSRERQNIAQSCHRALAIQQSLVTVDAWIPTLRQTLCRVSRHNGWLPSCSVRDAQAVVVCAEINRACNRSRRKSELMDRYCLKSLVRQDQINKSMPSSLPHSFAISSLPDSSAGSLQIGARVRATAHLLLVLCLLRKSSQGGQIYGD